MPRAAPGSHWLKIGREQAGSLCKKDAEVHGQGGSWGCETQGLQRGGCPSGLQDLLVFGGTAPGGGFKQLFLGGVESKTGSGWKLVMGACVCLACKA